MIKILLPISLRVSLSLAVVLLIFALYQNWRKMTFIFLWKFLLKIFNSILCIRRFDISKIKPCSSRSRRSHSNPSFLELTLRIKRNTFSANVQLSVNSCLSPYKSRAGDFDGVEWGDLKGEYLKTWLDSKIELCECVLVDDFSKTGIFRKCPILMWKKFDTTWGSDELAILAAISPESAFLILSVSSWFASKSLDPFFRAFCPAAKFFTQISFLISAR